MNSVAKPSRCETIIVDCIIYATVCKVMSPGDRSNRINDDGVWWSVVADPAGAVFYIMQLEKADPWAE